jgi:hypothetical protein
MPKIVAWLSCIEANVTFLCCVIHGTSCTNNLCHCEFSCLTAEWEVEKVKTAALIYTYILRWEPYFLLVSEIMPVMVAERSKVCTVFARSETGIVGFNPTQGMDVWCVYILFVLSCVLVAALRRADPPSKESYSL